MSKIKSSIKRDLQSKKKRKYNISKKSCIKNFLKKIKFYIDKNDLNLSKNVFLKFQSFIDRQSTKGLIHKNKASRYKKRIMNKIRSISHNE
ncbi:MAG: 30S ribosomal protein S20 [Candidatus Makana argininalis]